MVKTTLKCDKCNRFDPTSVVKEGSSSSKTSSIRSIKAEVQLLCTGLSYSVALLHRHPLFMSTYEGHNIFTLL